jgi:hypothetical protein
MIRRFRRQARGVVVNAAGALSLRAFPISAGALKTITNTNPIIKDPNVSGRNVTLYGGAGLGDSKAATLIDPTTNPAIDLTDAQKVALASAERSDLVLVLGGVGLPANASAAHTHQN